MADDSRINGFAWFLAGLGVGALAGILYAPKSGKETRDELAHNAREGTEYLRTRGRQVAEQVGTMVDRGKEQVGEYVDRGREVVDRGRAQWEEFVERGKSLVGEQSSRVTAAVDAGRQAYKSGTSSTSSNMTTGSSNVPDGTPSPTTSTTLRPQPTQGNPDSAIGPGAATAACGRCPVRTRPVCLKGGPVTAFVLQPATAVREKNMLNVNTEVLLILAGVTIAVLMQTGVLLGMLSDHAQGSAGGERRGR